jgi:hypothetical protein
MTSLLAFALGSVLAIEKARSGELDAAIAVCEANPHCTHGYKDRSGRVRFEIQRGVSITRFQCSEDGQCESLQPKGERIAVADLPTLLSAQ